MRFIYDAEVTVLIHTSKGTYEKVFKYTDYKSSKNFFKAIQAYYDEICQPID